MEDFREMLKCAVNDVLRSRTEAERERLELEDIDAGVFISPVVAKEFIKPARIEDLHENTGMLIEMIVREVDTDLHNNVMVRLQIDERGDVHVRNHSVQEAEILEVDVDDESGDLSAERKEMLERKSHEIASAVREAIKNLMMTSAR